MTTNPRHQASSPDWQAAMHREGTGLILAAATTFPGPSPVATGLVLRRHGRRPGAGR